LRAVAQLIALCEFREQPEHAPAIHGSSPPRLTAPRPD